MAKTTKKAEKKAAAKKKTVKKSSVKKTSKKPAAKKAAKNRTAKKPAAAKVTVKAHDLTAPVTETVSSGLVVVEVAPRAPETPAPKAPATPIVKTKKVDPLLEKKVFSAGRIRHPNVPFLIFPSEAHKYD